MLKTIEQRKVKTLTGIDAEMSRMKRLPRGTFRAKTGATSPANCKVKITMYLDADVLAYFKERAAQPNAAPYQTQINNELRKIVENGAKKTASVGRDILNDKKFLKALKKKLETV
ncbi:MAG: BrnA antitoxin family protein [Acidobacteria bacterium]|nr:BrnA antitoxin family protein [Acidobacteriota bacterium]